MNFREALLRGSVPNAGTNTNTNNTQVDTSAKSEQCDNSNVDYAELLRRQREIEEDRKRVQAEKDAQEEVRALEEAIAKADAERRAQLKAEKAEAERRALELKAEAEGASKVDEADIVGVDSIDIDPQPMQDNLVHRRSSSMMNAIGNRLHSAKSGDKRSRDKRTKTPKTPSLSNNIGEAILKFGEGTTIDEVEVHDIDNDINAQDMLFELGYLNDLNDPAEENNNKKKAAKAKVIEHNITDTTNYAQGQFLEVYNAILDEYKEYDDEVLTNLSTMRDVVIVWTNYTQEKENEIIHNMKSDLHYYIKNNNEKLRELVQEINNKRNELVDSIKKHLPEKYHGLVTVGTLFSIDTRVLHKLHYSPEGSTPDPNDPNNHSPHFQCCISTMMKKLINFLIHEDDMRLEGSTLEEIKEEMEKMTYGGRTVVEDIHRKQVVSDITPFDLKKKKKQSQMDGQYDTWAERLKLKSKWELFVITYNIDRLHMLLHRAAHPNESPLQVHCASASAALYLLGQKAGTDKYVTRFVCTGSDGRVLYVITFGGHPQSKYM